MNRAAEPIRKRNPETDPCCHFSSQYGGARRAPVPTYPLLKRPYAVFSFRSIHRIHPPGRYGRPGIKRIPLQDHPTFLLPADRFPEPNKRVHPPRRIIYSFALSFCHDRVFTWRTLRLCVRSGQPPRVIRPFAPPRQRWRRNLPKWPPGLWQLAPDHRPLPFDLLRLPV